MLRLAMPYLAFVGTRPSPCSPHGARVPTHLQAAQRRLAFALALLPAAADGTPARRRACFELADSDVARLVGALVAGGSWLAFTVTGPRVVVHDDGIVATYRSSDYQTALCPEPQMTDGVHYAEFRLLKLGRARLGVVHAGAGGQLTEASASPAGWTFCTYSGCLWHSGKFGAWQGQPAQGQVQVGDVIVRTPRLLSSLLSSDVMRSEVCVSLRRLR